MDKEKQHAINCEIYALSRKNIWEDCAFRLDLKAVSNFKHIVSCYIQNMKKNKGYVTV